MKSLPAFWRKDLTNKLIVIISFLLLAGIIALCIMAFALPDDKSVWGAVYEYVPAANPTLSTERALTNVAATIQAIPTATLTPMPSTITSLPTLIIEITEDVNRTPQPDTPTPSPTGTVILASPSVMPLPTATGTFANVPTVAVDIACLPTGAGQTAKVVEVLDGNTVRALIDDDGLVYTVRYIGIEPPQNVNYAGVAEYENMVFVLGKEVILISDEDDKDSRGRLLRYVMAGNTLVNLELLNMGLATVQSEPEFACLTTFKTAEQNARDAKLGLWSLPQPTPTPKP